MTKFTAVKSSVALAAILALGACSLTPNYERPIAPVATDWPQAPSSAASAASSATSANAAELP